MKMKMTMMMMLVVNEYMDNEIEDVQMIFTSRGATTLFSAGEWETTSQY